MMSTTFRFGIFPPYHQVTKHRVKSLVFFLGASELFPATGEHGYFDVLAFHLIFYTSHSRPRVLDPKTTSQESSDERRAFSYLMTGLKLSNVPESKNMTFRWRGTPSFVRHQTEKQIPKESSLTECALIWVVCQFLMLETYCPCHDSHYDASGSIRRGPAPLNLEVP
uniref:Rieske domain-containing protein n=1 Tax=Kryptolebias marmoratus TaxID=37003 RepID=A0A3Q3H2Z1_KRYMA